jgi:hypothetical protein
VVDIDPFEPGGQSRFDRHGQDHRSVVEQAQGILWHGKQPIGQHEQFVLGRNQRHQRPPRGDDMKPGASAFGHVLKRHEFAGQSLGLHHDARASEGQRQPT